MPTSPIIQADIATIVQGVGKDAEQFSGKTILISGGAGFLGKYFLGVFSYLNEHVLAQPCRVVSVDNYITGQRDPNFDYSDKTHILDVWGDVTFPLPIREDINYIIHAAGLASPVYYMQYPLETIESAVTGAKNLLELARRNHLDGFLLFSSSEIYGDPDPRSIPTPETYHGNVSSVGPRACYDESKRLAETIATIYQQHHGIPIKIIRPFNVFGPGMKHNDRRVVPMFAYQALNSQTLPVHGDGHQTRTFCYITDAMTGFLKGLLRGHAGEAYNIGNDDNEISMRDLAALFTSVVSPNATYAMIPYPVTYPAGEPQRRCPDLHKAKNHLEFTPHVSLRQGLERFIEWCRSEESYVGAQAASVPVLLSTSGS
ncbi:MAG: NAD-dependent epimerase/dehydratase family protein [Candidatus Andersenbacteria bacterium]